MKPDEMYSTIEKIAAGKITCQCGNNDWKQFLFVGAGDMYRAGCKRCATMYGNDASGAWIKLLDGPNGMEVPHE